MKNFNSILVALIFVACQPQEKPDPAYDAFTRNAETVKTELNNWVAETPDYSKYDEDIVFYSTSYFTDKPDSTTLEESKAYDQRNLERYDFEIMGELNPLPGVNGETKQLDGSVRLYVTWKVTKSATDSTEAKSAMLPVYHTYEFNEDGKITSQMSFADFGSLIQFLEKQELEEETM